MVKILKLYKYQSLSEEKHFGYLQNYLDQRVWLVPLSEFNDPFEGKCSLVSLPPQRILKDPELFDYVLRQHHLNGEYELTAHELKMRLNSQDFRAALINNPRVQTFERHGALCLTRKNNNIPMWAYYADNHKGYCIEFELDFNYLCKQAQVDPKKVKAFINTIIQGTGILSHTLPNYPQAFAFAKVRYSKKMPSLVLEDFMRLPSEYEKLKYFIKNSVGVKFIEWRHEDEFRLIVNSNSRESGILPLEGFAPFLKVTGVILGDRMEKEKQQRVGELCQNKKMKLYTASSSYSAYEIIIKA